VTQGALTLLIAVLVVAVGLATARIQSENHDRAGHMHVLEMETDVLRRGIDEIHSRLEADAFDAESVVTDEWGGPVPYEAHELSRQSLELELVADEDAAARQVHALDISRTMEAAPDA